MKAAATVLDVEAVRVAFALEAETWFVEQFDQHGYGKGYLAKYLGRPLDAQLLSGEEREKLQKHLREIRKDRGAANTGRLDGRPRKRADGMYVWPDGTVTETDTKSTGPPPRPRRSVGRPREEPTTPVISPTGPGPMIRGPRGPIPGPRQ